MTNKASEICRETDLVRRESIWRDHPNANLPSVSPAADDIEEQEYTPWIRQAGKEISEAFKALQADPRVNIFLVVGQIAALNICKALGAEGPTVQTYARAAGGVLMATICARALIAGAEAKSTAAIASLYYVVEQIVNALYRIGKGPDRNWCFLETGDIRIRAGVYASDDFLYFKTYQNICFGENNKCFFSCGQAKDKSFQVSIYDHGDRFVKHFRTVHYGDTFFVSRSDDDDNKNNLIIVFCKRPLVPPREEELGENRPSLTERYEFKLIEKSLQISITRCLMSLYSLPYTNEAWSLVQEDDV